MFQKIFSFRIFKKGLLLFALASLVSCGKGCQKTDSPEKASAEQAMMPQIEQWLPADFDHVLVYANIAKISKTPLIGKFLTKNSGLPFIPASGTDDTSNAKLESELLIGLDASGGAFVFKLPQNPDGIKKVAEYFDQLPSVTKEQIEGRTAYKMTRQDPILKNTVSFYISFLDSGWMVGGFSLDSVKSVFGLVDQKSDKSVASKKELVELYKQNQKRLFWMVVSPKLFGQDLSASGLKWATIGFDFDSKFIVQCMLYATDLEKADAFKKTLQNFQQNFGGILQTSDIIAPMLKSVSSRMKIEQKDAILTLSVEIDQKELQDLATELVTNLIMKQIL